MKLEKIIRYVLGSILILLGLNKGLNFINLPTPPEAAITFLTGIASSGYIFPTLMVFEILFGLSLILNKWTNITILLLVPLIYNIVMYHLFLDINGIFIPIIMLISEVYLIYTKWQNFKPLFS